MRIKLLFASAQLISAMLLIGIASPHAASLGPTPEQKERHLELFRKGATLWPIYCNHCHNAREPAEFAPYQWDQIIMHMRTLENLPPQDADAILEYLKTAR
jgi:hypothetical protein